MITGLQHLHSLLRWVVLVLMIIAVVKAIASRKNGSFTGTRKIALFAMISLHLQLVIGLSLYFLKDWHQLIGRPEFMGDTVRRFFSLEHLLLMLIAIVIATIGYSSAKRMKDAAKANKRIMIYYLIALILILISIPWPFRPGFELYGWI